MNAMPREFVVHVDRDGRTIHAGTAYIAQRRGRTATTFIYSDEYLRDEGAYSLSPDLPVQQSRHAVPGLPGAFADSAPDRWGRNLITKRLRTLDQQAGITPRALTDVDSLLGVSDLTRQGALRYADRPGEPFRAADNEVPRLVELPALMRAADAVVRDDDDRAAVKMLLDAGTGSLGGARPKASVRDGDRLLIAKFAHPHDTWDVMGWEKTALDLATAVGIPVPRSRLVRVDGRHTLLVERFDRTPADRVGYISAMTLVGAADGEPRDYLEVAEALAAESPAPKADLAQLWRRLIFYCAVTNTDDHLRNLGFLRTGAGWTLAPAFDINPNPEVGAPRQTTVGWASPDRGATFDALLQTRADFGIDAASAQRICEEVGDGTSRWRHAARANGISETEIERFGGAFQALSDRTS